MSRMDDAKQYEDALEDSMARPIPSPRTIPTHERCAESGWRGHLFNAPFSSEVDTCWYCHRTKKEVVAMGRKAEAA